MKPWMGWTAAMVMGLAVSASAAIACEEHAQAADAKDAKAVAANAEAKGCDKPCCAKKTTPAEAKNAAAALPAIAPAAGVAPVAAVAAVNAVDPKPAQAPCAGAQAADGKHCPKKAAMVAKAEPAKEAPQAEPAPSSGSNR